MSNEERNVERKNERTKVNGIEEEGEKGKRWSPLGANC